MVLRLVLACFALEKGRDLDDDGRESEAGEKGLGLDGC